MTRKELRHWAESHARAGSPVAQEVLSLLDEVRDLKRRVTDRAPEEEVALPAPQTTPFNGSTGTPADGKAGYKNEGSGV